MKKFIMMLAIAVASCLWTPQASAETYRMRYVHGNTASASHVSHRTKTSRQAIVLPVSRTTVGKFSVRWMNPGESSFNTSVKSALTRAFQRWSERLQCQYPVYIDVNYEEMAPDLYAECYVGYEKTSDNSCVPTSYYWNSSLRPVGTRLITDNDAGILINSNAQWDFSTETQKAGTGMHLETLAMRCIAQALGFGTTLIHDEGGVFPGTNQTFTNLCGDNVLSPFDKLVFDKLRTSTCVYRNWRRYSLGIM